MLATCCATSCVREGAPQRGDARRRCLPFLASFGLSKFWAAPAHQRRLEGAERLRSDLCASRRCAACVFARIAARTSSAIFFLAAETRDEAGNTQSGRRCTQSAVPGFRTKAWTSLRFGYFPRSVSLLLGVPSPSRRPKLFGHFHAENASIDCGTTAFVHNPRRGDAQPSP